MFNTALTTYPVKGMTSEQSRRTSTILSLIGKLNAVIRKHGVNDIRHSPDKLFEKGLCLGLGRLGSHFCHDEFWCAIDGDKKIELAFLSPELCNVDMEEANGIRFEFFLRPFVTLIIRKTADAMALHTTTVQREADQPGNRCLRRRTNSHQEVTAYVCEKRQPQLLRLWSKPWRRALSAYGSTLYRFAFFPFDRCFWS